MDRVDAAPHARGRKALVEMARRNLAHCRAGTVDRAPSLHRVPARSYTDPERARSERERVFGRLPLVLAFSCELREAGAYKATEALGVPVLIVRAEGGVHKIVHREGGTPA